MLKTRLALVSEHSWTFDPRLDQSNGLKNSQAVYIDVGYTLQRLNSDLEASISYAIYISSMQRVRHQDCDRRSSRL